MAYKYLINWYDWIKTDIVSMNYDSNTFSGKQKGYTNWLQVQSIIAFKNAERRFDIVIPNLHSV